MLNPLNGVWLVKIAPHKNNMSSIWQRKEISSQPVYSTDQVFELSMLRLSRFKYTVESRYLEVDGTIFYKFK